MGSTMGVEWEAAWVECRHRIWPTCLPTLERADRLDSVVAVVDLAVVGLVVVVDRSIRIRTRVMGAGGRSDFKEQGRPETGVAHRVVSGRLEGAIVEVEVVVCAIRYTLSLCICLYSSLVSDVAHLLSCIHCVIEFTLPSCHASGFLFFRPHHSYLSLALGLVFRSYLLLLVDIHSLSKPARLPLFLFSCFAVSYPCFCIESYC